MRSGAGTPSAVRVTPALSALSRRSASTCRAIAAASTSSGCSRSWPDSIRASSSSSSAKTRSFATWRVSVAARPAPAPISPSSSARPERTVSGVRNSWARSATSARRARSSCRSSRTSRSTTATASTGCSRAHTRTASSIPAGKGDAGVADPAAGKRLLHRGQHLGHPHRLDQRVTGGKAVAQQAGRWHVGEAHDPLAVEQHDSFRHPLECRSGCIHFAGELLAGRAEASVGLLRDRLQLGIRWQLRPGFQVTRRRPVVAHGPALGQPTRGECDQQGHQHATPRPGSGRIFLRKTKETRGVLDWSNQPCHIGRGTIGGDGAATGNAHLATSGGNHLRPLQVVLESGKQTRQRPGVRVHSSVRRNQRDSQAAGRGPAADLGIGLFGGQREQCWGVLGKNPHGKPQPVSRAARACRRCIASRVTRPASATARVPRPTSRPGELRFLMPGSGTCTPTRCGSR